MAGAVIREVIIRGKTEGLDQVTEGLNRVAAAEGRVTQAAMAMDQGFARAGQGTTTITRGLLSSSREFDRLVRSVDPVANAMARMERFTSVANRELMKGSISLQEHTRVLELASRKYGTANDNVAALTKTHQLAAHQVQNLRFQLQDVATSLAGGASPLTVLAQQGGQIAGIFGPGQGGVLGILRGISQAIPRSLALGGAGAAVAGIPLIAAERYQREEAENRRTVLGVGRGSGLTSQDIEGIAGPAYGREGGLSVSQGRDLARSIAGTGYGSRESIQQARSMFRDLSATLGEGTDDVNQRFAMLFRDPVKGADELNTRLGFLTGSTRDYIKSLAEQGDNTRAAEVAMKAMAGSLGKYTDLTGETSRAFDTAKGVVSDFFTTVQRGADRLIRDPKETLGKTFLKQAEEAEQASERVVKAEQRQAKAVQEASDEQIRRIRDRAEVMTSQLERGNILARRDPLSQSIFEAQREAGVAPPITARDREAEGSLSARQRAERQLQAEIIARQVAERNTIDISKALTEQTRSATIQTEAETAAIGKNIAEQERLRFAAAARIAAGQGGKAISQETIAQIDREAAAYGRLADQLARTRFAEQQRFDRAQLGRTQGDQQIATSLRGAGLGSIDDPANASAVAAARLNQELTDLKETSRGVLSGFISDLRNGASATDALRNALNRILDRQLDKLLDQGLSALFKPGQGGLFDNLVKGGTDAATRTAGQAASSGAASLFGGASSVATMTVNAAVVNINGGLGAGSGMGLPGGQGSTGSGVEQSATSVIGSAASTARRGTVRVRTASEYEAEQGSGSSPSMPSVATGSPSAAATVTQATESFRPTIPEIRTAPITQLDRDIAAVAYRDAARFGIGADQQQVASLGPSMTRLTAQMRGGAPDPTLFREPMDARWTPSNLGFRDPLQEMGYTRDFRMPDLERASSIGPTSSLNLDRFQGALENAQSGISETTTSFASLTESAGSLQGGFGQLTSALGNVGNLGGGGGGGGGGLLGSLFSGLGRGGGGGGIDFSAAADSFASSTSSAISAVSSLFAEGGYTGRGSKHQPAGIVHAGEYVFSQESVNRLGLRNLDRLHRGYADGGYVAGGNPVGLDFPTMPPANDVGLPAPVQVTNHNTYNIPPVAGGVTPEQVVRAIERNNRERDRTAHTRAARAQMRGR